MTIDRPLFVLGTGGLAREMAQLIAQTMGEEGRRAFAGFISASAEETGTELGWGRVVGDDQWLLGSADAADLVVGIGHPSARAGALARYASDRRFAFPNLIHPSAMIDPAVVRLGRGNTITAGCIFTCDIEVADFNLFNWNVTVGHDARIGSANVINPGVNISGGVRIGDRVLVGTGAQILEGRGVGDNATVGAGAVVTRDVSSGETVVGVPARPLRQHSD